MVEKIFAKRDQSLIEHTCECIKKLEEIFKVLNEKYSKSDIISENFFKKVIKSILLHDIGKFNPEFQERVNKENYKNHLKNFFENLTIPKYFRHEILSAFWSCFLLDSTNENKQVRLVILLHHYNEFFSSENPKRFVEKNFGVISRYLEFFKKGDKLEKFKELVNEMMKKCKEAIKSEEFRKIYEDVEKEIKNNLETIDEKLREIDLELNLLDEHICDTSDDVSYEELLILLGFLRRCDYAGSGHFNAEEEPKILDNITKRIKEKLKTTLWQEKIIGNIGIENYKGLVLIAPTGSGKTEFALLLTEKLRRKSLYTLPLRVALNDLYRRFKNYYGFGDEVNLLHSTAFIEYLDFIENIENIDKKIEASKMLSHPLNLTTPDQILLTSLNYYGSDKIISLYPYSIIVVDEIQSYTPDMCAVILRTLELIKNCGGKILIMTATLPEYYKELFKDKKIVNQNSIIDVRDYKEKIKIKNIRINRHKVKLINKALFNEKEIANDGWEELKDILNNNKNKNILIVVNNVSKAIELFKKLEKENGFKDRLYIDSTPMLLHSRLIEGEKEIRINKIKDFLENSDEKSNKKLIVVATQIVEASVDIDFDILITEISPIESQIQRWGRIWRNRDTHYIDSSPNIYIFTETDKRSYIIYNKQVIEQTKKILKEKDREFTSKILTYENEIKLIDDVYKGIWKEIKEEVEKYIEKLKYFSCEKKADAQRIFRRIAGIQILIPDLLEYYVDEEFKQKLEEHFNINPEEFIEKLIEILKEKSGLVPWKDILKKLFGEENIDKNIKWEIMKILYKSSTSIPIFYWENIKIKHNFGEFRVFKVLLDNLKKNKIEEIKKYGIDVIFGDKDIDREELKYIEG